MGKARQLVQLGAFTAMAIALNMIENLLPLPLGIRFGMAHIISLCVVRLYGIKWMWIVNMLRVFVAGLLSGMLMSYPWLMSLGGVLLSSLMLTFLTYYDCSLMFTGVLCAIAHNVGQIIVLSFFVSSAAFVPYLAVMTAAAIITGIMTGMIAETVLDRLRSS